MSGGAVLRSAGALLGPPRSARGPYQRLRNRGYGEATVEILQQKAMLSLSRSRAF